jgi:hypothetical protein
MSIKLNDTQLVLLCAASQRDDHCLVPASDCFVRNYNSALREQIFDVSKADQRARGRGGRVQGDGRHAPPGSQGSESWLI